MTDLNKIFDLRSRRKKILGKTNRTPALIRVWADARGLLKLAGNSSRYSIVIILSVILPAIGIVISLAIGNPYFIPTAVIIGAYLPPLFVMTRQGKITRKINDAVKKAVGLISNTYISTEDIIKAFKDNLSILDEPIKTPCAEFVAEASFLQANVPTALLHLRDKIDNAEFRYFCSVLIECNENKDLKYVLPVISNRISDKLSVQTEIDTIMYHLNTQFHIIVVIALLLCAILPIFQPIWWHDLISTAFGKISVAMAAFIAFLAFAIKVHIMRPIKERW